MKKWLIEYEVISSAAIKNDVAGEKISFKDPSRPYLITIENLKTTPGTPEPLLSVQIILDADSWEEAKSQTDEYILRLLDCMSFNFSLSFKRRRIRRAIDWTPSIKTRDYIFFQEFADPNNPLGIINEETFGSVKLTLKADKKLLLNAPMVWYRRGVNAEFPEEAFQYFWFSLEVLAGINKRGDKAPDKCPRCQKPLYCPHCEEIPTHKPYPKQAIGEIIRSTVKGSPDAFYKKTQAIRHALMHGELRKDIEKELSINFDRIRDQLGNVVLIAILNALRKNTKNVSGEEKYRIIIPKSYARFGVQSVAAIQLGPKDSDPSNPKLEDYPYPPLTVTMQTSVDESFGEPIEHLPID